MPDTSNTALAHSWATTFAKYTGLNHSLVEAPHSQRDQIEREIASTQDDLLDTPAPTLVAVRQKLEMLWEGKMGGLDQSSEERRLILEDLDSLIHAQRELLGA